MSLTHEEIKECGCLIVREGRESSHYLCSKHREELDKIVKAEAEFQAKKG